MLMNYILPGLNCLDVRVIAQKSTQEIIKGKDLMKIEVDQTKCRTVGTCVRELPEIFHFQEGSKKAAVTPKEIPLCMYERCLEVATHCPNGAIIIQNE